MEFKYTKNEMAIKDKIISALDSLVIEFTSILNKYAKYVIVSGYVAILFGRSRTSEDIDIIVEKIDFNKFNKFWIEVSKNFECISTKDAKIAHKEYLSSGIPIRFSRKNNFIPNVEFKFPKVELDDWTLKERKKVILNDHQLFVSPLELQIPFKLFLGSEKDIEDAKHIYRVFQDKIDYALLQEFNRKFKTNDLFNRYLK
jgi:hypothetical protein